MKKALFVLMIANLFVIALIGSFSVGAVLAQPDVVVAQYTPTAFAEAGDNQPDFMAAAQNEDQAPSSQASIILDPYQNMFIDSLAGRASGAGTMEDLGAMNCDSESFSRRHFRYPSEGMEMYGFINVPDGDGPFPVVILLHGHVKREGYNMLTYTSRYADALAEDGYIVIHPNLRGYLPTPDAENQLGVGDSVDILNLIAIIRRQSGEQGLLKTADASNIGLWGHSMGGGIVMRVMVIDSGIKAGLLYASVHADESINLAHFQEDGRGYDKCQAPEKSISQISPLEYLDRISAPISIHHGDQDERVPVQWSDFLYERLLGLGKPVSYQVYEDQLHTFRGEGDAELIENSITFFNQYLKN